MIAWATEIKVRAERRCGEMLIEKRLNGEMAGEGRPKLEAKEKLSHDVIVLQTLTDIGLTFNESSRYQKLARMPEKGGYLSNELIIRIQAKAITPKQVNIQNGCMVSTKAAKLRIMALVV